MENRKMLIEKEIKINAYDIDAMGIVSNIVYIRWFEDLRFAFLDNYYPYPVMMKLNISPILIKTESQYKTPLTIFDKPIGRCWMVNMGKSRWEMEFEIISGETLHCLGKQLGCFYDLQKKRPTLIPQLLIDQF
ncbi:thioesterase family protein [Bacillus subtilis]|uniref:thioesterase family protein n=1 Tax=Bacillus subtilis TaxID=1423 RepID=UPI002E1E2B28|nr:thioesterase family protein [Bacillus subtilis]MED3489404.1 thioesterase family protein [Bacillus subtilis]